MDIIEFLKKYPIIRRSELAKEIWPESKHSNVKLINKIKNAKNVTGVQRITEQDTKRIKQVLKKIALNLIEDLDRLDENETD